MYKSQFILRTIIISFLSLVAQTNMESFTGTYVNGEILIEWETASEGNTAGYNLHRSLEEKSEYVQIFGYIPAEGGSESGWHYSVIDFDIVEGTTYYYLLESVDFDDNSEYYGPITVFAGNGSPHPTPTQTDTPAEVTMTFTPTQNPSSTPTIEPSHTATDTGGIASTQTPFANSTVTPNPSEILSSPTDLVETQMIATPSSTPSEIPILTSTTAPTSTPIELSGLQKMIQSGTFIRVALILIIIPLWAILAIGGYIFLSQRGL